jgi:plastocyanin
MRTAVLVSAFALEGAAALLAGCYGSSANHVVAMASPTPRVTPTPLPTATAKPTPTPTGPTPTPTAQPQVVHIGFELAEHTDPTYGPVYFYSPTLDKLANVVTVKAGSALVFLNDGTPATQHTGSGLGTSGFPASFDNSSGFTQSGSTIDSSLTWSTGTLNPGQMSQVFTVGPPGAYYFGCAYHYFTTPTKTNGSMGDVIVSM